MSRICKRWTQEECQFLRDKYPDNGKEFCATALGRNSSNVRHKTSRMGLRSKFRFSPEVNLRRKRPFLGKKRPDHAEWLRKNHPLKGKHHSKQTRDLISKILKHKFALGEIKPFIHIGFKHSEEAKLKMSLASRLKWADPNFVLNSQAYRQSISDRMSKRNQIMPCLNRYSRGTKTWATIGENRCFFRSSWELMYAQYLQFLKENGNILDWKYEVKTFWFESIRRGVRSYKPDFLVTEQNGSQAWHEVKGWMDQKSKTKISRMRKYYPSEKLIIIGEESMKQIMKWKRLFDRQNPQLSLPKNLNL